MLETPRIEREHMEAWLSAPRYGKYLETASGDDALAFELCLWNIGLAQAVLRDVSFFEIALEMPMTEQYPRRGMGWITGCLMIRLQ